MEPKQDPGIPVPAEFIGDLLGLADPEQVKFAKQVVAALEKISPDLVPRVFLHPYRDQILSGPAAFEELLGLFRQEKKTKERVVILDAIAEIVDEEYSTQEVIDAMTAIIDKTKDGDVLSVASRVLAASGDEAFLDHQRNFLATDDPVEIRRTAKLLGYGRDEASVGPLLEQLRPDNIVCADVIVWALGRIGSNEAVPKLHSMLNAFEHIEEVCEALGKIGSLLSIPKILPFMVEGTKTQREAASGGLVQIVRKYGGKLGEADLDKKVRDLVKSLIDTDTSHVVRLNSLLAFNQLGGVMDKSHILAALGGSMTDEDLDAMALLYKKRGEKTPETKKKKKKRKPL